MKKTTMLRQLLDTEETLVVPGCFNAMGGRILEEVGYPAIYMTGYGTSLSLLGMPDAGLASMREMHLNARYISNAVKIPLIADADNGYGNAINVIRTVREYIQTGTAAIHIEDQIIPKRCGHVAGRLVIPLEEAVGKYKAASDVRNEIDPDFIIIARTDARGAHGGTLEDAITRANAYLAAGADVAFVEGPTSVDEVKTVCREVDGPIMYNQTGISPRFSHEEMTEIGIAVTILPGALTRLAVTAMYDFATKLKAEGPLVEADFYKTLDNHPVGNLHTFAGFDQIRQWEEAYLEPDALEKYADSVGHQPGS